MKILILGPLDYPSARADLILINYNQNVYSTYYVVEGILARAAREHIALYSSNTIMSLVLSSFMTDKEYNISPILFGLVPKTKEVDMIICYNKDVLESQEAYLSSSISNFVEEFYSVKDVTHFCDNIMEAIKLAQSKATEGNQ